MGRAATRVGARQSSAATAARRVGGRILQVLVHVLFPPAPFARRAGREADEGTRRRPRRRAGGTKAEEKAAGRQAREIERLKKQLDEAAAKLAGDEGVVGKMEAQLQSLKTRVKNLTLERDMAWTTAGANPATVAKPDWNAVRKVLHPDTWEHVKLAQNLRDGLLRASKIINGLKVRVRD